jgi:pimeloyl-ACP methyl ester carboxylesterase
MKPARLPRCRHIPDGTGEQFDGFNEPQRKTTSPECAARSLATVAKIDVSDLLGRVRAPTLVMHAREEVSVPFEQGRMLADGIPGARFVALPGATTSSSRRSPHARGSSRNSGYS